MRLVLLTCCLLLPAHLALAQEPPGRLALELNRIDLLDGACRLTFLTLNSLGADLDALSVETVLIDT